MLKLKERIINLLFPPKCTFCGRLLWRPDGDAEYVCRFCRNILPYTSFETCKTTGDYFTVCVSPFYYKDGVRDAVLRLKFGRQESLARPMGHYLAGCLAAHPDLKYDAVTWVPISRRRKQSRGFDQARLIASQVATELKLPLLAALKKVKHTPAQSSLKGDKARRENISGAYQPAGASVSGKRILLIDDVVTTGSTLSECSRVLLQAGADLVVCAAFAKARRDQLPQRPV